MSTELDLQMPQVSLDLPPPQSEPAVTQNSPATAKPGPVRKAGTSPIKQRKGARKENAQGGLAPIQLELISIGLLAIFMLIMFIMGIPVDKLPSLSLSSYVQCMWLLLGCLFVVAMLQNFKAALVLTGIDFVMMASLFPTLWLIFNMRMNPMYFFVLTLILLLAFVYIPVQLVRAKRA